ncbi:MAG: NAD(P)-dependent oxidoreductase [Elusimicrobiota bacterium]|nr:NAD(P)-dependent oxidoreductase [Elusimicrobiota bacterium]
MRRKPKILVTVPVSHLRETRRLLESAGRVVYTDHPSRRETLRLARDADAIFPNTKLMLDREVLDAAPRLRVICTPSTGTDHIDKAACAARGVTVMSLTKDMALLKTITSTAEHAFGLTLNIARNMPWSFDSARKGEWDYTRFRGRELQGRTVGIVGYGRLGSMYSRFARGFDMKVLAHDPFVKVKDRWVEQVGLDALLRRSEIITLHVHLTPETRGMVDASWFRRMRPGVFFVNTSRGGLVDERALLAALKSGRVRAAGLDVLDGEIEGDMSRHPLVRYARAHDNLMITPHCGGMSYDGQEKAFTHAAGKLVSFFKERRAR